MRNIPDKHRGIRWSQKDTEITVNMYELGFKISEIANKIDRSTDSIQGKLKTMGIRKARTDLWSELEINLLISLRKRGKSFKEIALELNRTERSIQGKHNRLINPPKPKKTHKKNNNYRRIYSAKDDYFSIIDSQKKAYYLGFIMTDGFVITSVNSKGRTGYKLNRLGMKLSEKDIDVLYDLRNELCSQVPLQVAKPRITPFRGKTINSNTSYSLHITSEQIIKDLAKYGIVQNKTYGCEFPQKLELKYYPGFIAGVLSGDGYVGTRTCHGNKAVILRSALAGTKPLLDGVREVLIDNICFNPQKKPRRHTQAYNLHTLELNKKETLELYYWMKDNGTSLMPRKNKIIEDFIENYPEKCIKKAS